ncbi:MAG: Histone H1 [Candidatus Nitrospira kreftii]|uniref:Histone H1 n=1 Tax=Candidatus Nitrospira kreftii TaxID=2652173 RepID=A0A7S8FEV6_9BACT|nr:MAG: Histone H1 [Candidatus Nitrospira kreftii]
MLSGMQKKPKRPRDPNQLGKLIVDISVGEADDSKNLPDESGKDPAAVALGKKGGKARAASLSNKRKSEIAKKAAISRWEKRK